MVRKSKNRQRQYRREAALDAAQSAGLIIDGGVPGGGSYASAPAQTDLLTLDAGQLAALPSVASPMVARLMACGFNINSLRTNDVLRPREWELYDRTVVEVTRAQLVGVADLMNAGLVTNLANPLGTMTVVWDTMGDMTPANMNMTGLPEGERDRLTFGQARMPVPITHKDFQINLRTLEASRRGGQPLDTTHAAVATRKVNEMLEQTLFAGASITSDGGTIYGYTNHPSRLTGSVTANWTTATGDQILADVMAIAGAFAAINRQNLPIHLYVSVAAFVHMGADFKAASDRTILDRVLAVPGIGSVRPTSMLTGTNIIAVQFTRETVDLLVGFQPMPIMWETHAGFMINFKVMAIIVPRLRTDANGQMGLAHYS
jgi:hypothetical protein